MSEKKIKFIGDVFVSVFCTAVIVFFFGGNVLAAVRDLTKETEIKASIVSHNSEKQAFSDNTVKIINKIAIPMIAEAKRLEAQAAAIRAEVDSYLKTTGITEAKADTYLNLVDNKIDRVSLENKSSAIQFLKAVTLLVSEKVTDVEITDPNIIN